MSKLRICGIIAAGAFLLSFLLGLLSRATMPLLLIRSLIFAAIFFLLPYLVQLLVPRFLPELLQEGGSPLNDLDFLPGSRVNITDDDSSIVGPSYTARESSAQVVNGAKPDDSNHEIGDISELSRKISSVMNFEEQPSIKLEASPAIDQNPNESYNGGGVLESLFTGVGSFNPEPGVFAEPKTPSVQPAPAAKPRLAASSIGGLNSEESLPDLDSIAESFSPASRDERPDNSVLSVSISTMKPSSDKAPEWVEDYSGTDIARGIQTVLKKDKEA
jgi:hypothetical protein